MSAGNVALAKVDALKVAVKKLEKAFKALEDRLTRLENGEGPVKVSGVVHDGDIAVKGKGKTNAA